MVDKHLHMKIHMVIDFFQFPSLLPSTRPRPLRIHGTVGLCSEHKILFYIASILEYLLFFLDRICISFSFKHAMLIGF